ncbi:cupin domain-containing protein [Roseomonas sp. NAR14]|uniref:Cupin domain-containing protein n=1 Tax=Roseomonas acroporae TaxID=2937791 RepID=A0A9X2BTY4_9PROT|nr:cupin domain-containing protein [Roseomonas acroporae]MCK8785128.1 cupin domain-containing protein [Roseomonas acroporae]
MSAPRFGRLADGPVPAAGSEAASALLAGDGAVVERIASRAHASPPGFWYDAPTDEFVLLVAGGAALGFPDGSERRLDPGDYAILPAGCRHRVAWTDPARETLWLAVHLRPAADGG